MFSGKLKLSYSICQFIGALLFLLLCSLSAHAGTAKVDGLVMDGAIGYPAISISNPDGTVAGYKGVSLQGRIHLPLYNYNIFRARFHGVIRYHDLENKISDDTNTEVANHIGTGAGLSFFMGRILVGYDYAFILARHYFIAKNLSNIVEYKYSMGQAFAGYQASFGDITLGINYNFSAGAIPAASTGLQKDSDYKEQTIWLNLTYNLGASLGDIFRGLAK